MTNKNKETYKEKLARHAKVADEIAHQFRGALKMFVEYDKGFIDKHGNKIEVGSNDK